MLLDTTHFINNCSLCQTTKVSHQAPAGLLQPLPIPQRPWSHIAIDFITDLPESQGHTTILTVIDRFSKVCRLIPLTKLPTAFETAELLCNWVFRLYGLPEDIVSDRGPQFTSRVWTSFFKILNVNVSLTLGYHPDTPRHNTTRQTGAVTCCTLKILSANPPRESLLSNASWASNLHCFPGRENHPICHLSWSGCRKARRPGTKPTIIYNVLYEDRRYRPIDADVPIRSTPWDSGSGCPLEICDSDFYAENSVPGL